MRCGNHKGASMQMRSKIIVAILLIPLIYFLPWLWTAFRYSSAIESDISSIEADATIVVLGAHIRDDGSPTEILQQRLDAAIVLHQTRHPKQIIVSNTADAAFRMRDYLLRHGIPADLIAVDTNAELTSDTCAYLIETQTKDPIVLLSQGYHLPRLLYLCQDVSRSLKGYPVETISTSYDYSFLTKLRVRSGRYLREAGLTWAAMLGVYY